VNEIRKISTGIFGIKEGKVWIIKYSTYGGGFVRFKYYVHGLWIFGSIMFFIGAIIAMFWQYDPLGSTVWSNAISLLMSFVLFLMAGLFWISAAINARQEGER